ncbi:unnamed protein product [Lymnaea stagnalis]|uniref:Uncharacterized protein n=1 Tax=Lymnaea stagnalis TaxID=6523 RepID=A0AAV2HQ98_LYMST
MFPWSILSQPWRAVAGLVSVVLTATVCGDICCVPDQFEANLIYDNANVFIDANTAYSYTNSTAQAAYDYTNNKTYVKLVSVELSPLIPQPVRSEYTILTDYVKGVQYQFTDTHCEKSSVGSMQKPCIPDNAIKVNSGFFGNNQTKVVTFQFTPAGTTLNYLATIDPTICMPVVEVFVAGDVVPDSGSINSVLVSDVTPGIKDPTIFDPPKICLTKSSRRDKAVSPHLKRLRRNIMTTFPFHTKH